MLETLRQRLSAAIYRTNAAKGDITPLGSEYPTHSGYEDYRITAESLLSTSEAGVCSRLLWQVWMLIEHGRDIKIVTPEDEEPSDALAAKVQEVTKQLWRIDSQLDISTLMPKLWYDEIIFGDGLAEMGIPVDEKTGEATGWGEIDGWAAPEWVQYLDAYSFAEQYQACNEPAYVVGRILKGIAWKRETSEMEYWQIPYSGASAIQIPRGRVLHIKDKKSRYVDGQSYLAGVAPVVSQLEYVRKAFMQNVASMGVKRLALQVKEMRDPVGKPLPAPDGSAEPRFKRAYKFGEKACQNWGNNQVTQIWEDHNPIWAPDGNLGDIIQPDEYLHREILNHLIPRDFIEQNQQAISTTGAPLLELVMMVVKAWRDLISEPFEDLYTDILEANGFTDWAVEFTYLDPNLTSEMDKQRMILLAYQAGMLAPERAYKEMGWDAPTDEEKTWLESKVGGMI